MQDWLIVVWKASIHALPCQPDHRSPPLGSCRCPCRCRPLIVVFGPPLCPRWPGLRPPSQLSSSRRHPCCGCATTAPEAVAAQQLWWQCSDGSIAMTAQQWQRSDGREGGGAAMAMAAQQRQWRRSNGNAAMATAAQRWRRRCIDGLGSAATAMAMAVQGWGWPSWWWRLSNGGVANDGCGAAMVMDRVRPLFELYRALFLSNKFKSYVAFYIGPIQTGFLRGFQKSYGGTGIVIPVKKVPQERKTQESG